MSRTLKDRPYWVLKNDPTLDRYADHKHHVVFREHFADEPVYRSVLSKDGFHWEDQLYYTRGLYKRWSVNTDCTIDVPEGTPSSWRFRSPRRIPSNEERLVKKNCSWQLNYYPNTRSNKDRKRLTNGATRSKVRQQLHNAVRDNGNWTAYVDWEDVDLVEDSKYSSSRWWD